MYTLTTSYYFKNANLCTVSVTRKFLTKESLKDAFDWLRWDHHSCSVSHVAPEGGKIIFSNGNECCFVIRYNGRFCKKYSHGVI